MAWISLGKLLLFVCGLVYFCLGLFTRQRDNRLRQLWSVRVILLILLAFALSLTWSEVPLDLALLAFVKHSKLLEIVILVSLIRHARDARLALLVFLLGQTVFILSSWAMVAGLRVPWATSAWATVPEYKYAVFSTYLDQTLIFSASAAVLWHLSDLWPKARWAAMVLAVAALTNVLFFQQGKTGYLAAMVVVTLAVIWRIPKKWRWFGLVLVPLVLVLGASVVSEKLMQRAALVLSESQNYVAAGTSEGSSGFRLHAWRRSVQAILEKPVTGHGVGSWTQSVKKIEGARAQIVFGEGLTSNPHQEFLLWGVELGVLGTMLLVALVASLIRDALTFSPPVQRATLSVVAVMVVACLFNSALYDALIGDFFCIVLGLLLAMGIREAAHGCNATANTQVKAIG